MTGTNLLTILIALLWVIVLGLVIGTAVHLLRGWARSRPTRETLQRLRDSGSPAWLCAGPMGMHRAWLRVVCATDGEVSCSRPTASGLLEEWRLPRGTRAEKCIVRINTRAQVEGIAFHSPDGRVQPVALYPDPSLSPTRPLQGLELDHALGRLRSALER